MSDNDVRKVHIMNLTFADTPKGWYQARACGILASLSLMVDTYNRMQNRGGSLRWLYQHEIEYHFGQAVFDTLRLLQMLTNNTNIAASTNLDSILDKGHSAFDNIIDDNMDGFDLEKE